MASGLYTKNNLSEKGLNATDAIQKLYAPQIQQDILLFSFANRLESEISSPDTENDNQVYGLINEPISDSQGNVVLRTKFVTLGRPDPNVSELQGLYTYSDNNLVWFDKVSTSLDKRTTSETYGAPVKVSVNGSLTLVSVNSIGENYKIVDVNGNDITLPAFIDVRVKGVESGETSAKVRIAINTSGKIDLANSTEIVSSGSGYLREEFLEIIPGCGTEDNPAEDACLLYDELITQGATYAQSGTNTVTITLTSHNLSTNDTVSLDFTSGSASSGVYTVSVTGNNTFTIQSSASVTTSGNVNVTRSGGSIIQDYFVNGQVSTKALLKNELYTYRVLFSDRDGFFLYDDKVNEYVYFGSVYNTINTIVAEETPSLVIKRLDSLSSQNLVQLYNLSGRSAFWTYGENYESGESISGTLRGLSNGAESLRDSFKLFIQNAKQPSTELNDSNTLGTQYNILEGKSINSDFRVIFRDPDGILDQPVYEKSGTYSQSGSVITVNSASHGLSTSDTVYLLFTTGSAVNSKYTVTVTGPSQFTVSALDSKTTTGNVEITKGISFTRLASLNSPGQTNFAGENIPGIWLWTGEKYQRVFSSDEKAFMSVNGKKYLSPAIYGENGVELGETGNNKYSISASYLKPGTTVVKGFDTIISTLIQNISGAGNPNNGGFVYHRTLSANTVRVEPSYTVFSWPLFSYREGNLVKDAKLLAI